MSPAMSPVAATVTLPFDYDLARCCGRPLHFRFTARCAVDPYRWISAESEQIATTCVAILDPQTVQTRCAVCGNPYQLTIRAQQHRLELPQPEPMTAVDLTRDWEGGRYVH